MLRNSFNLLLALACSSVDAKPTQIAILGDSITQGDCPPSDTVPRFIRPWSSHLNSMLKQVGDFEMINYSVGGATPCSHHPSGNPNLVFRTSKNFKQLLQTEPDVVLIMIGTNGGEWTEKVKGCDTLRQDYEDIVQDVQMMKSKPKVYLIIPPYLADVLVYPNTKLKPGPNILTFPKDQLEYVNKNLPKLIQTYASELQVPNDHVLNMRVPIGDFKNYNSTMTLGYKLTCDGAHMNFEGSAKAANYVFEQLQKTGLLPKGKKYESQATPQQDYEYGKCLNDVLLATKDITVKDFTKCGDFGAKEEAKEEKKEEKKAGKEGKDGKKEGKDEKKEEKKEEKKA